LGRRRKAELVKLQRDLEEAQGQHDAKLTIFRNKHSASRGSICIAGVCGLGGFGSTSRGRAREVTAGPRGSAGPERRPADAVPQETPGGRQPAHRTARHAAQTQTEVGYRPNTTVAILTTIDQLLS